MSRKIWMKKLNLMSNEDNDDIEYYLDMSREERLEIVQFLREQYLKINGMNPYESGKGLQRTIRIVQRT